MQPRFSTPILLTAFNRPDNAARVFDEIRKIRPKQLFWAVDGPRKDRPGEDALCKKTQDIIKRVDWECEVKTLFRTENLGCGYAVAKAIDWFFENVEEGIIFEDDDLPDPTFFRFCQELLEYYRDDRRIMHISGDNFQHGKKRGDASYYFSRYTHIWGWATWRRAWKYYDYKYISRTTYDKAWLRSVHDQKGLAVLPNVNLVSNIGYGGDSTHTSGDSPFSDMPTRPMQFPLIHPKKIKRDVMADFLTYKEVFDGSLGKLLFTGSLRFIPKPVKSYVKKMINKNK
jgi:hypothetical protein